MNSGSDDHADGVPAGLPRSGSEDEALEIAIREAETSIRAMKLAKDPAEKAVLHSRIKLMLEHAERIKTSSSWEKAVQSSPRSLNGQDERSSATPTISPGIPRHPQSSRALPKSEQILLYKASYLNGHKFPPWTAAPAADEFTLKHGEDLFIDDSKFGLSDVQREAFAGWRRPAFALPPVSHLGHEGSKSSPSMKPSRKIDLIQDASTDCSVVASLCAGVARGQRGHHRLLQNVLYPYDAELAAPRISENGRYVARLNFNGCSRRVIIDDRLPTSSTAHVIHVMDRHNPTLLWPALIEKAYLKVRGGYDFPGSNSATDLWILSGWIPEQLFLRSDDLDSDRLWKRMLKAFDLGDLLVTMGTAKMSATFEREIGLAGEHDYAVLDLREVDGQRLMLVKNPWCEGTSWRGSVRETGAGERNDATSQRGGGLHLDDAADDTPVRCSRDLLNSDAQMSPGTFWMDVENVLQYFESIYLNWNPGLFAFRQDMHFTWDLSEAGASGSRGRYVSLYHRPQFAVSAQKGGIIWLLLWRHFRDSKSAQETARAEIDLTGFISLFAFAADGERVKLPEKVLEKSNFVDSPQILLKLEDCKAGMQYTLVPAEQELPDADHGFTISAFSNSALTLGSASQCHPHSLVRPAAWTKDTAGGNAHSTTYTLNPQFAIFLPKPTRLSLSVEADNDELNVHLKLVHGKGQRIRAIRNRDIVFDSSDYRRRCCVAASDGRVDAGAYTVVCSTFEPQQLGNFKLLVESDEAVKVALLPREDAGRLRKELKAVFPHGSTRIAAPLALKRLVNMYAVARPLGGLGDRSNGTAPLLRLTLEQGKGLQRRVIAASRDGEYTSVATGPAQTDNVDLAPEMQRHGDLWIVLARMCAADQASEEKVMVDLFIDQSDAIDSGDWRVWDD